MKAFLHIAGLLLAFTTARADGPVLSLLAGPGPLEAGKLVTIELLAVNPAAHEVPFPAVTGLSGILAIEGRRLSVTLSATDVPPSAVPAGGFAARRYELVLPPGLAGDAILTVQGKEWEPLRVVLPLVPSGVARPENPAAGRPPLERLAAATPAVSAIARNFAGRFLPNQPVYFLYGDSDQAAKFQFSFDYRLATVLHGEGRGTGTVRLGYTQRTVWDIDGQSSPFYDTSYLPELAYSHDMPMPAQPSRWFTWLGWRAGLQHESNGKEGFESRSLDTVYVRPRFVLGTLGKWAFVMLPEFQAYLGESSENSDIDEYRGYGKLRFYFGHNQGPTLMVSAWAGKDLDHGTWQLDLAVPTRLRWLNLESYFHVQYFNGYGESLRDYRRRSDALRAGFSLVR